MDEVESFVLMANDIKKVIRYNPVMEDYKMFENKYKEAGY